MKFMKWTMSLKNKISRRFSDIERNEIVAQDSILDPRFKQYGFMNENKFKNAYSILRA